jgi:hypothetical protein
MISTIKHGIHHFHVNDGDSMSNQTVTAPVSFCYWTLFACSPPPADLDADSKNEIVFAGDDTIYIFKMTAQNAVSLVRSIPFGTVPANRLFYSVTPQPVVTKITE